MEGSRELTVATEKHVLPPQVHMNVKLMHAPPHPTPTQPFSCFACHLQGTLTCPTPPQPLKCVEEVQKATSCHGRAAVGVQLHGPMLCAHKWMGMPCSENKKTQYSTYPIIAGHSLSKRKEGTVCKTRLPVHCDPNNQQHRACDKGGGVKDHPSVLQTARAYARACATVERLAANTGRTCCGRIEWKMVSNVSSLASSSLTRMK